MKLYEWQAKELLKAHGIKVPRSTLVTPSMLMANPDLEIPVVLSLMTPLVVKAQILAGGRGKAGGILFRERYLEAVKAVKTLLGKKLKTIQAPQGEEVKSVLVEEKVTVEREIYLSFIIDRSTGRPKVLVSPEGGVEIEEIAKKSPEKIKEMVIHPLVGFTNFQLRKLAFFCGFEKELMLRFSKLLLNLYRIFQDNRLHLLEINPLVSTSNNEFVSLDAKIILDSSHPLHLVSRMKLSQAPEKSKYLRFPGSGNIGMVSHGAGMALATINALCLNNLKMAGFIDIDVGASLSPGEFAEIIRKVLADSRVKFIFGNIYTGVMDSQVVVGGFKQLSQSFKFNRPMIFRLEGPNRSVINKVNKFGIKELYLYSDFADAFNKLMKLAGGKR